MRIGFDARMYGEKQTGIGVYISQILEGLYTLANQHELVVFMLPEEAVTWQQNHPLAKVVIVKEKWYSWGEQLILPWRLYKEKIDLMHFPHFNSPIFYRRRQIITIHDITPMFFPGHKMNSWLRRLGFWLTYRQSLRKAAKIIAVSEHTKHDIVSYFNIRPEKIVVIYEGVNEKYFMPVKTETIAALRQKYGLTKKYLLYIGVWRNHKNVVGLLQAFNQLVKSGWDYQLVLGGREDPFYPEVRQTWEKLNLTDRIIRPGFIPASEMVAFYAGAEVLVIPSFYEGFGLHGLEALAAGVPVAASHTTSLPEVLGEAALYFDPHKVWEMSEVLKKILANQEVRNKLILAGQERVKKFNWQDCVKQTVEVYNSLV